MGEKPHNPWRTSLENCANGDNYLRHSEWMDLIDEIDGYLEEIQKLTAQRDEIAGEALHALKYIKQCLNDGIGIEALKEYRIDESIAKIEQEMK